MIPPKNIFRTDRIGDVVLTLPTASIIKKHYPECKVTFLVKEYTKDLVSNNPNVDDIIVLKEENGKLNVGENINALKNKFDVCVVVYPTFPIARLLFQSNIKTRIGTGYRWYSFLFNKKVYDHRKYGERHELEYNLRLLSHIGITETVNEKSVQFNLHPDEKSIQIVDQKLSELNINNSKQIVIIHPGSGGSAVDLPVLKMKLIVERMARELDCEIIITGSDKEKELCDSFIVNEKTKNIAGHFDLGGLTALIDKSVLLIANSTGPIHIAAALGKYVVGFYPKFPAASQKRWGPYTDKKKIFEPELKCENCTRKQCEKLNCMDSININNVFDSIKNILLK